MSVRLLWVAVLASALAGTAACSRSPDSKAVPAIALTTPADGAPAYVEVTGLSASTLRALDDADLTPEQWASVLRVAVGTDAPAILGQYTVADGALRFTPLFPFDQGRQYQVRFDAARLPGGGADAAACSKRRSDVRRRRTSFDGRRARLPERRRGAREPAPDVRGVLGADGTQERCRVHLAARPCGQGDPRRRPAARLRVLEPGPHAVHRLLRSRPGQEGHPAEPAAWAGRSKWGDQ